MSPPSFNEIWLLVYNGWRDLLNTDFNSLRYSDVDLAVKVGVVMVVFVLFKLSWILICKMFGWHKYYRTDSGYTISRDNERGLWAGLFLNLPRMILLVPLVAILFAIADPFLVVTKEEKKYVEVRTRIDFRDLSESMTSPFRDSNKSKAEVAMDVHLKFLEMRRGKKDRTAFWIFSNDPYPVQENFIVDDELYYLKAFDAPWELGSMDPDAWTDEQWQKWPIPKTRFLQVYGQGGTQLTNALKMAIKLFDDDDKKQKNSPYYTNGGRSILMVTDAAIADFDNTKSSFEELSKRKIIPYIIFIDETAGEPHPDQLTNISKLLEEVTSRGGKFFPVSDEKSIENAYREIDKLEMGKVETERKVFKTPAFYKFVFIAIVCLLVLIIFGLLAELLSFP